MSFVETLTVGSADRTEWLESAKDLRVMAYVYERAETCSSVAPIDPEVLDEIRIWDDASDEALVKFELSLED